MVNNKECHMLYAIFIRQSKTVVISTFYFHLIHSCAIYIDFSVKTEMAIFGLYLFSDNVISLMAKAAVAKRGVCHFHYGHWRGV